MSTDAVGKQTGTLFGDLWQAFDEELYRESVELFDKRCAANGFDPSFFKGKCCLDAGCGGGRSSIAMAGHGASVVGIDISETGIADARTRIPPGHDVEFRQGSVLDLPFENNSFDFVWSAGVLHHTANFYKGLDEITRVLRPGGKLFLLIYGVGGFHWESTDVCRPSCALMGYDFVDRAVAHAGLPANKRKSFMDCFFVPLVGYFTGKELELMLRARGFTGFEYWMSGRLDHEESPEALLERLVMQFSIFEAAINLAGQDNDPVRAELAERCRIGTQERIMRAEFLIGQRDMGLITAQECWDLVVGHGNTRMMATKG